MQVYDARETPIERSTRGRIIPWSCIASNTAEARARNHNCDISLAQKSFLISRSLGKLPLATADGDNKTTIETAIVDHGQYLRKLANTNSGV